MSNNVNFGSVISRQYSVDDSSLSSNVGRRETGKYGKSCQDDEDCINGESCINKKCILDDDLVIRKERERRDAERVAAAAAESERAAERRAAKAAKEAAYIKSRVDLLNKIWVSLLKEGIYFENMYPFIEKFIRRRPMVMEYWIQHSSLNEDIISRLKEEFNSGIFPLKELIEATAGKGEDDELFWYPPLNEGLKIIIREARGRERERREEREREEREREREEERQRERERSAQWRSWLPGARFGAWGEDARQWAMYGELWGGDYKNKKSKKKLKKTNKRKQKSKKYRKKTKHKQKSKKSKRRNR